MVSVTDLLVECYAPLQMHMQDNRIVNWQNRKHWIMDTSIDCNESNVRTYINELDDPSWMKRQFARFSLVECGEVASPTLINELSNPDREVRWEVVKALGAINDQNSAQALVEMLMDDDTGVRWAAMEALIRLNQAALLPLIQGLVKHFDSTRLREGAHHVLHNLQDKRLLSRTQVKILEALQGVEPEIEVAWAAERALEEMQYGETGSRKQAS
jgi:HEAT repeat protein